MSVNFGGKSLVFKQNYDFEVGVSKFESACEMRAAKCSISFEMIHRLRHVIHMSAHRVCRETTRIDKKTVEEDQHLKFQNSFPLSRVSTQPQLSNNFVTHQPETESKEQCCHLRDVIVVCAVFSRPSTQSSVMVTNQQKLFCSSNELFTQTDQFISIFRRDEQTVTCWGHQSLSQCMSSMCLQLPFL